MISNYFQDISKTFNKQEVWKLLQEKEEVYDLFISSLISLPEFKIAILKYRDFLKSNKKSIIKMSDDYGNQKISNKQVQKDLNLILDQVSISIDIEEIKKLLLSANISTKLYFKLYKLFIEKNISNLDEITIYYNKYQDLKNKIVIANLKLTVSLAKKYVSYNISLEDLIQEGNIALIRAVEKFSTKNNAEFSTYASWWLNQAFMKAVKNQTRTIRLPEHVYQLLGKIKRHTKEYKDEFGCSPSLQELANRTGKSIKVIEKVLEIRKNASSMQNTVNGTNNKGNDNNARELVTEEFFDFDSEQKAMHAVYENVESNQFRNKIKNLLSATEYAILVHRFGLEGQKQKTLQEISNMINLSKERIRQLEANALETLRKEEEL